MKGRTISLGAALLVAVGFLAGYMVNLGVGQGAANASGPSASGGSISTVSNTSTSPISLDAAIEAAFQKAQKSVVFVNNVNNGTGSGIIYDATGDIVTNDHVVSGGKTFRVTFSNGVKAPATLVGVDPADDLAVLHVSATGLTPATFASASSYRLAETVLAIGSPLGLQQSVTDGLISGLNRTEQEPTGSYIPDAIQTSAPINPGNSGGALVNLSGDIVGIPTIVQTSDANNTAVQNIGFAIPSSRVTFIVPQLIQYGKVQHTGRAFLGVSVADANSQSNFSFGYTPTQATVNGAVIQTIKSTSPAAAGGMRQGDIITKFNGVSISSSDDLLKALAEAKPSETVSVTYNRGGASHTAQVTLAELPAVQ